MAIETITNVDIDNACALVDPPYGPLTRIGNAPNTSPNSTLNVEVQSALGVNFFITYEDLTNSEVLDKILADVHGGTGLNHQAYLADLGITVMYANIQSFAGPPYSDVEYAQIVNAFRFFQFLAGLIPHTAYIEYDEDPLAITSVVTADNGGQEGQIDAVLTGRWLWAAIDWGDGTPPVPATIDPVTGAISETYTYPGGAGTYTIRLIANGPGGITAEQADQIIA